MHIPGRKTRKTKLTGCLTVLFFLTFLAFSGQAFAAVDVNLFLTTPSGTPATTLGDAALTDFNGTIDGGSNITLATSNEDDPYSIRLLQRTVLGEDQLEFIFVNTDVEFTAAADSFIGFNIAGNILDNVIPTSAMFHEFFSVVEEHLERRVLGENFFDYHYVIDVTGQIFPNGELSLALISGTGTNHTNVTRFDFSDTTGHGTAALGSNVLADMAFVCAAIPLPEGEGLAGGSLNGENGETCPPNGVPELPLGATSAVLALLGFGVLAIRKKISK